MPGQLEGHKVAEVLLDNFYRLVSLLVARLDYCMGLVSRTHITIETMFR